MSTKKIMPHSERAIQYCFDAYVFILKQHIIRNCISQTESPYDNAVAERINGILKDEWSLDKVFSSYSAAVAEVYNAVDSYNRLKPYMSCGNLNPQQAQVIKGTLIKN